MRKRQDNNGFGRHKANVRKMSSALTGYGTVYRSVDGKACGLIAPSMAALERTFKMVCTGPFHKSLVKKVILFEHKSVSVLKNAH